MECIKKQGRKKKGLLEKNDLDDLNAFQETIRRGIKNIGVKNLTLEQKKFIREYFIFNSDNDFTKKIKAIKFKSFILHKPLTQEECTYVVDIDNKGTKPTEDNRLTKMSICKIEMKALSKLKKEFGNKMNVFSLQDVLCSDDTKYQTFAKEQHEED